MTSWGIPRGAVTQAYAPDMPWLVKHPQSVRSPSGLEWRVWKRLPMVLLVGTVLPLLIAGALWLTAPGTDAAAHDPEALRQVFVLIGVVLLHWTLVLTVAIGCGIVMLMKGPTYVADPYPLPDSDTPVTGPRRND